MALDGEEGSCLHCRRVSSRLCFWKRRRSRAETTVDDAEREEEEPDTTVLVLPTDPAQYALLARWIDFIKRSLGIGKSRLRSNNYTQTTKYTRYNFLFKCFMEQLNNISNLYFAFILVLAYVGQTTSLFNAPYNGFGILTALALVIAINMAGEGYYDLKRNKEDKRINGRDAYRLRRGDGHIETVPWSAVCPGDVLKVYDRQQFPADMIFLANGVQTNKCYVETSNIDGETNLKIKYMPKEIRELCSFPEVAASLEAVCTYESPNALLSFSGKMDVHGPKRGFDMLGYKEEKLQVPLEFSNLLLRGSVLRNTPWILGLVVYAGPETKVVKSSSQTPSKVSKIQASINRVMIIMLFVQLVLCTISSLIEIYGFAPDSAFWYLQSAGLGGDDVIFPPYVANVCSFLVLYSSLIPIALLVIMTIVKLGHAMLINWDLDMYHEETDTPSKVNTIELVQELGQIDYVFSDKTGTLTRNEMKLVGCSIAGRVYGVGSLSANDSDSKSSSQPIAAIFTNLLALLSSTSPEQAEQRDLARDFLMTMAVCHTVLVDKSTGERKYNAEGPDEEALVIGAAALGFKLLETNNNVHQIEVTQGASSTVLDFSIYGVNEFNSTRKRMSCVCRDAQGRILVLAKGADNIMFDRLKAFESEEAASQHQSLLDNLDAFANDGLRTLVFARRYLDEETFSLWQKEYTAALAMIGPHKVKALEAAAEIVEKDFEVIGASAIEDRLQDGVPETLVALREAGIKTWVLTGDKVETAVNIAFSAGLLTSEMELVRITSESVEENLATLEQLQRLLTPVNLESNSSQRRLGRQRLESGEDPRTGRLRTLTMRTKQTIGQNFVKIEQWTRAVGRKITKRKARGKSSTEEDKSPEKRRSPGENGVEGELDTRECAVWPSSAASGQQWVVQTQKSASMMEDMLDTAEPVNVKEFKGTEAGVEGFVADNLALVISGSALAGLLSHQMGTAATESTLLSIARLCHVVVGCRMSPKQKALVVKMVSSGVRIRGERPITLAIGDGANDVAMIQEARVGVGISGHEGRQAVNSSDFAIAQFRFLRHLMLVHGRWNYLRVAATVLFVFYSQIIFTGCFFIYNCFNRFSGTALFYEFLLVIFSYPSCSAFVLLAITNKDISKETALAYPAMYISGRDNLHLRTRNILIYVARSFLHTFFICSVQIMFFAPAEVTLHVMGTATYFNCILVALGRTALETYTWTWLNCLAICLCLALFLVVEPLLYSTDPTIYTLNGGTVLWAIDSGEAAYVWRTCTLGTALCMIVDVWYIYIRNEFFPDLEEIVIEIDRGYSGTAEDKQVQLKRVNRIFRQIAQPLKIPKVAISELLSSVQNVNIGQARFRSAFAYAEPQDEQKGRARLSRSFFFKKRRSKTNFDTGITQLPIPEDSEVAENSPVRDGSEVAIDVKDSPDQKQNQP